MYEVGNATNIAIAQRVMREEPPFTVDDRGIARHGPYNVEVRNYSGADAIAVPYLLPKLRERCSVFIHVLHDRTPVDIVPVDERISVELAFNGTNVMGKAGKLALALCRAALALADETQKAGVK